MTAGGAADGAANVPHLGRIRDLASRYVPDAVPESEIRDPWQAATALVVAPGDLGAELVLIERVHRDGDPWSGHMALPGGKREDADSDLAATAARETREEVGIALDQPVGRLDDQVGRTSGGRVATYVFVLDERPAMTPHPGEVADALWVPLRRLFHPRSAVPFHHADVPEPFPGLDVGGRVVWGLTHRTLESFAAVLGLAFPLPR
jgi:8-oxo-dGTP pyrophosphatase MutT (NUDIX family)